MGLPAASAAVGGLRRFFDIAVPRDISSDVNELDGEAHVYNVDDLKEVCSLSHIPSCFTFQALPVLYLLTLMYPMILCVYFILRTMLLPCLCICGHDCGLYVSPSARKSEHAHSWSLNRRTAHEIWFRVSKL